MILIYNRRQDEVQHTRHDEDRSVDRRGQVSSTPYSHQTQKAAAGRSPPPLPIDNKDYFFASASR